MNDEKRPVVAGLGLTWREFRVPPRAEHGSDEGEVVFGLWVPDADLDTLVDQITQEEFERSDERLPYFARIWPAAASVLSREARFATGPSAP